MRLSFDIAGVNRATESSAIPHIRSTRGALLLPISSSSYKTESVLSGSIFVERWRNIKRGWKKSYGGTYLFGGIVSTICFIISREEGGRFTDDGDDRIDVFSRTRFFPFYYS